MDIIVIDRYNGNGTYDAHQKHRPGVWYTVTASAGALRIGQEMELKGASAWPRSGLVTSYSVVQK